MMRCLLLALSPLIAAAAPADQALVVGVDLYKNSEPKALKGPGNDARSMARFCQGQGYTTQIMIGSKATKAAILGALDGLIKTVKPGERVIFYFAGHGTNRGTAAKPRCCLLPFDYANDVADSGISVDELYDRMKRLPTRGNRTVILDACYSGGMSRDPDGFASRGYSPRRSRGGDLDFGDDGAPPAQVGPPPGAGKDVCYLTAASATEKALEYDFNGSSYGIFTKALIPELARKQTCEQTETAVRTSIAKLLREHGSGRKQTPEVTPEYKPLLALSQAPGGAPPTSLPPPKAVWDLLAKDRPNVDKLTLQVEGRKSGLLLGEPVAVSAKVGKSGYLVVVWSGKKLELLRPLRSLNGALEAVKVEPGVHPLSFSSGGAFTNAGENRVTALLFESPAAAQSVIDSFRGNGPPSLEELQARGVVDVDGGSKTYVSSAITFEVGEELVGGYRVLNPKGMLAAIQASPTLLDDMMNNAGILASAIQAKTALEGDPKSFSAGMTTALNLTLYGLAARHEPLVGPDEKGLTPAQAELARSTAKALLTATPAEGAALNARLLAALLPNHLKAVES